MCVPESEHGSREPDGAARDRGAPPTGSEVMARLEAVLGLRAFVETVNDTVYLLLPDGVFAYVSPNWAELVGEPPSAPLGRSFEHYVHPDDVPACNAYMEALSTPGQRPASVTYRVRRADGEWRWHEARGAAISLGEGRGVTFLGIARDVTEARRAREEVSEALNRIHRLADHVPGVLYQYCLRPDGSSFFPFATEGIRDIYGVTPDQVVEDATPVFEALHPDDIGRITESITDSARNLTVWHATYRVCLPGERVIWVEGESSPQAMPDGSVLWHGYIREVTQRMRADAALRDSESLLRGTLDALAAHIGVIDADGRLVLTNRAFREFAVSNAGGLERVAEGANYLDACREAGMRGSRDGLIFERGLRAVLDGAASIFAHKYADHAPSEPRWFIGTAAPVKVATDSRSWAVIAHEDVTERELTEQEVQRRLAFESLIAELAGRFVGATQEDALAEVEVALGRIVASLELSRASFWRRFDPEALPIRIQCHVRLDGGPAISADTDAMQKFPWVVRRVEATRGPVIIDDVASLPPEAARDRSVLEWFGVQAAVCLPQFNRDGKLFGVVAFSVTRRRTFPRGVVHQLQMFANIVHALFIRLDTERALIASLEERQRLQEQLTQAQKLESIGRLAGGVAHDFNNLMMGIMGYTEACREELEPTHPARGWLDDILKESGRSVNLVRQLLAFARKQVIQPQHLDLNAQIDGMTRMLRRLIGERVELVFEPEPAKHTVYTDPSHIDQILANLCVNAADAITGNGVITISTRLVTMDRVSCLEWAGMSPGAYVLLSVSDTGSGMDEATRARAFEPFFTTKEVGRGTGLGLATVYGVVKQSNGFIYIESEPGAGTTIRIFFPASDRQANELVAAPGGELSRGRETILLVEDEHSIRTMLAKHLARLGYEVLVADHPQRALALAEAHPKPIRLLLSDVVMPGMSGVELQQALAPRQPSMETILMTGYASESVRREAGPGTLPALWLEKPVTLATLAKSIRSVLGDTHEG